MLYLYIDSLVNSELNYKYINNSHLSTYLIHIFSCLLRHVLLAKLKINKRNDLISCVVFINLTAKINMRNKFDHSEFPM